MQLAMIGLGKMGANMARRLIAGGHTVVGYNLDEQLTRTLAEGAGLVPAFSLGEAIARLDPPRVVWVMVPSGEPTETTVKELAGLLDAGDIVVDGGNSNFNDSMRRASGLKEKGIAFIDVGTSGGVWGLQEGYSMMVGGEKSAVDHLRPVFSTLAPEADKGWGHVGPSGAGHYVKMVHNGIEYGLMEAYAEGFELLKARRDFDVDVHQVSEIWRFGSVVRSWLLDLISVALQENQDLEDLRGWVADSGEGRWTIFEAINNEVPAPVIAISLFRRFQSRQVESYSDKLLAAMRHQFGGHPVKKE